MRSFTSAAVLSVIFLCVSTGLRGDQEWREASFESAFTKNKLALLSQVSPRPREFADPKYGLLYSWFTYGFVRRPGVESQQSDTRFAVFCQSAEELERTRQVTRFLLRLWDLVSLRLQIDHPLNMRTVDVFLSWGGSQTGGEHTILTPQPKPGERPRKHNLIHIFQTSTLTDPVEWAREMAHEYGHAVLPGITGYPAPEAWANGLLGERLFLNWVVTEMENGRMHPEDVFGATAAQIKAWTTARVRPLINRIWARGVNFDLLIGRDDAAMTEYAAFALYLDTVYGSEVLRRAMLTAGGNRPVDFLSGAKLAVSERRSVAIRLPETAAKVPVYVYLPGSKWTSKPAVTLRHVRDGWHKVLARGAMRLITFTHRPSE